jgi:pimeloyl-ACP methyl ester carboxylesterase
MRVSKRLGAVLLAFAVWLGPAAAMAATPGLFADVGRGEWTLDDPVWKAIDVETYTPAACAAKSCPLVIVIHGAGRNAANSRNYWIEAADRYGVLIAAPRFDKTRFPGRLFQQGAVRGQPDRSKWTFGVVERLFDAARAAGRASGTSYRLFGHSAGGQFVHRMALLMPEARFSRAVVANAGYYTRPLDAAAAGGFAYPYSLGGTPATDTTLRAALGKQVTVMLGERDTNPEHRQLNRSVGAEEQGATRFARGQHFMADIRAVAARLGVTPQWREITVPGVAHQQDRMARAAAPELLGP